MRSKPTPEPSQGKTLGLPAPADAAAPEVVPGFLVCRMTSGQGLIMGPVELVITECRQGHVELAVRAPRDVRIRRTQA